MNNFPVLFITILLTCICSHNVRTPYKEAPRLFFPPKMSGNYLWDLQRSLWQSSPNRIGTMQLRLPALELIHSVEKHSKKAHFSRKSKFWRHYTIPQCASTTTIYVLNKVWLIKSHHTSKNAIYCITTVIKLHYHP